MKVDILDTLRFHNLAPKLIRDSEQTLSDLQIIIAEAADEIEKLRKEVKSLKED